jgi:transposase-like protein
MTKPKPIFWDLATFVPQTNDPLIHPAAEQLPMMGGVEIAELAINIKKNGLVVPIEYWIDDLKDPKAQPELLDGRCRCEALKRLGIIDLRQAPYSGLEGKRAVRYLRASENRGINPWTYVLSKNAYRRHLNAKQKRDVIARFLKADPQASDREIARESKSDHKMVGRVRRSMQNGSLTQIARGAKERAKAALVENPDASIADVAQKVGVSERTVVNAKQELSEPEPKRESKSEPEPEPALDVAPQEKDRRYVLDHLAMACRFARLIELSDDELVAMLRAMLAEAQAEP